MLIICIKLQKKYINKSLHDVKLLLRHLFQLKDELLYDIWPFCGFHSFQWKVFKLYQFKKKHVLLIHIITMVYLAVEESVFLGVSCNGWVHKSMVCHTEVMTLRKFQASKFCMSNETQIGFWNKKEKMKTASRVCIAMTLTGIHKG